MQDSIFTPLNLTHTSYTVPADGSVGIIPGDDISTFWAIDAGDESPYIPPISQNIMIPTDQTTVPGGPILLLPTYPPLDDLYSKAPLSRQHRLGVG